MKNSNYSLPKNKLDSADKIRMFGSIFGTGAGLYVSVLLLVGCFFPESPIQIKDAAVFWALIIIFTIFDFKFYKFLCSADDNYAFFFKVSLAILILQGGINILAGWESPLMYILAILGIVYCFIFAIYTYIVFDKLNEN